MLEVNCLCVKFAANRVSQRFCLFSLESLSVLHHTHNKDLFYLFIQRVNR